MTSYIISMIWYLCFHDKGDNINESISTVLYLPLTVMASTCYFCTVRQSYLISESNTTTTAAPSKGDAFSVKSFFIGVATCLGFLVLMAIVVYVVRRKCCGASGGYQPLLSAWFHRVEDSNLTDDEEDFGGNLFWLQRRIVASRHQHLKSVSAADLKTMTSEARTHSCFLYFATC